MSAWFNGILGVVLSFWIGRSALDWDNGMVCHFIVVDYFLGFLSPLLILKLERIHWMRRYLIPTSPRTWLLFLSLYLGGNAVLTPHLQSFSTFLKMLGPMILTTGFSILTFGLIQDFFVHKRQTAERTIKQEKLSSQNVT